jgi:glycopeptide antibiotics resistance protein
MQSPVLLPEWLIISLGLVLPWINQMLVGKLPGIWKTLVTSAISLGIAILIGMKFLGITNIGDLISNGFVIFGMATFVYQLAVKRVFAKITARTNSTLPPSS